MRSALLLVLTLSLLACGGSGSNNDGGDSGGGGQPTTPPSQSDTRISTDPAGAELSLFPSACCDGQKIYVAWYDRRNGDLDVYFNRSLDAGKTWLPNDIRLDSGVAGAFGSLIPRICCSGSSVYVTWYDTRNGEPDIYFNRSLDSGATWLPNDVRISTGTAGASASREPVICCDGPRVYVAWHDDRDTAPSAPFPDWNIYGQRSLDSGATWLPSDVRIDRGAAATNAQFAQLACAGTNVVATWLDERRGGGSVLFNRSLDSGQSWEANDTILDDADAASVPRIAVSGTTIHVAWTDARSALPHIRYNSSSNVGVAWLANDIQVDGSSGAATNPSICTFGIDFYVVWQDTRSGDADVYFQHTQDRGTTWLASDLRLTLGTPGVAASWDPIVCCTQQDVHVVWRDDRAGAFDILLRRSGNRGASWSSPEIRMNTNAAGSSQSLAPQLCCSGPFAGVVWMDGRNGDGSTADIYFNLADFAP